MSTGAFIGLGIMGGSMATHLVGAGHDVVGYNRSRPAVQRLVNAGGRPAASVGETVRDADVVITMLPDSPDVESVTLCPDGIHDRARIGTLHIDCCSILPDTARQIADKGSHSGIRTIDAPVSGGEPAALVERVSGRA